MVGCELDQHLSGQRQRGLTYDQAQALPITGETVSATSLEDLSSPLPALMRALAEGTLELVDLTRVLSARTPVIKLPEPEVSPPPFRLEELSRYDTRGPDHYWNAFSCGEHVGTHMDAPVHWYTARDGLHIDEIPAAQLIGPAVVIDRELECERDPDYLFEISDLEDWESAHGPLPQHAWILLRTGWDRCWEDERRFFSRDDEGKPHWPGVSVDLAKHLAGTDILGLGVETLGTDAATSWSMDPQHPFHHFNLGAGKSGLANLAALDRVPPSGAVVIAAPLRIEGGSGSPARVLAFVPR